jgi:hypothetical protein
MLPLEGFDADNRVRVQFEHIHLQEAFRPFGQWADRLALALAMLGMALASALLLSMTEGPMLTGRPALGPRYFLTFDRCILHSGQRPGLSEVTSGCMGQT